MSEHEQRRCRDCSEPFTVERKSRATLCEDCRWAPKGSPTGPHPDPAMGVPVCDDPERAERLAAEMRRQNESESLRLAERIRQFLTSHSISSVTTTDRTITVWLSNGECLAIEADSCGFLEVQFL